MKYITAFTTLGCDYPDFVNVSGDDKIVRVSGRSGGRAKEQYTEVEIPRAVWNVMLLQMNEESRRGSR